MFTWLLTLASLVGVVANIYKKQWCFYIWLSTNSAWMAVDFYYGIYAQAVLFLIYALLAIWGIVKWK